VRPAGVHLLRPVPPWRESRTWRGRPPGGLAIVSPEAFAATCREDDARGFSAHRDACHGCRYAGGDRRASWDKDPVDVIRLDCTSPRWETWRATLRPELRALAALAARHQKEFRTLLERETVIETLAGGPDEH
jgi:hypothetical protein